MKRMYLIIRIYNANNSLYDEKQSIHGAHTTDTAYSSSSSSRVAVPGKKAVRQLGKIFASRR